MADLMNIHAWQWIVLGIGLSLMGWWLMWNT
jgi:hypothetical protein